MDKKNIAENRKRTCIVLLLEEAERLIEEELDKEIVNINLDLEWGVSFTDEDNVEIPDDDIKKAFGRIFDVRVTSIHADDSDPVGLWIVYEEIFPSVVLDEETLESLARLYKECNTEKRSLFDDILCYIRADDSFYDYYMNRYDDK
jgi:hypothetical protein